ncbi:MAG: TraB domain-containing protein, partial [Thermoplasmata archaeon]|nr:TraB domain-containing protein [Thermoplasmata archaeon]
MIILVGVGHVFDISEQIHQIILEQAPVAVGLELDRNRLSALLARERGEELPRQRSMLARFQERMAKDFGVQAGDEMLAGFKAAKEINAKLLLIDMDINQVIMKINRELTVKEKLKMFTAIFATPFIRKKTVEKEMARYEEEGEHYLEEVGKTLPTVKRILLDERNVFMAMNLRKIEEQFGTVLAVIGDGHVPGISKIVV